MKRFFCKNVLIIMSVYWALACSKPPPSQPLHDPSAETRLNAMRATMFKNGQPVANVTAEETVQKNEGDVQLSQVNAEIQTKPNQQVSSWKGKSGPVEIAADTLNTDQTLKDFKFSGHVRVKQNLRLMFCESLLLKVNQGEINWMKCQGPVRITEGPRVATGGIAIYDSATDWIELTGNYGKEPGPKMVEGENQMVGEKIRVNSLSGAVEVVSPKGVLVPEQAPAPTAGK